MDEEERQHFKNLSYLGFRQTRKLVDILEEMTGLVIPTTSEEGSVRERFIGHLAVSQSPKGERFSLPFVYRPISIRGEGFAESYELSFGEIINNSREGHSRPSVQELLAGMVVTITNPEGIERFRNDLRNNRNLLRVLERADSAYSLLTMLRHERTYEDGRTLITTSPVLSVPGLIDKSRVREWVDENTTTYEEGDFVNRVRRDYGEAA